jgi:hypothetical protein
MQVEFECEWVTFTFFKSFPFEIRRKSPSLEELNSSRDLKIAQKPLAYIY